MGGAIPKPANDQNTDDIVPARYLKEITFRKMGGYVYFDERFKDGEIEEDHPFNDKKYQGANILVAGSNYGCGSSREHAPQALQRSGIDGIIAGSFAEIFAYNCASLGIVGVTIKKDYINELMSIITKYPQTILDIDLEFKSIGYNSREGPSGSIPFDMPEGRRQAFLNGTWDAMAILQKNETGIKEAENRLPYLNFK